MNKAEITVFNDIRSKSPKMQTTLQYVLSTIKKADNNNIQQFEKLRCIEDAEEYKKIKSKLPVIYFTGTFLNQKNSGIKKGSGYQIIDFDGYPNPNILKSERNKIESNPFTYVCFLSPSGKGLKVLIKIPKTTDNSIYNAYFKATKQHYNSTYFDSNNKGIARACFYSYDPDLFLNDDAKLFTNKVDDKKQLTKLQPLNSNLNIEIEDTKTVFDKIIKNECANIN